MDPELLNLLLHIVVSHAYRPDSEPTRSPRIPEATIVKHAAELDRTLEMQIRLLKRDTTDGPFTEWDSVLGGALLKRRKV
jgi:3'-5' exoribonuclease